MIWGATKKRKMRTSMISLRTFGTSEKKNNANTPAATPKDAAVSPLSPLLSASQRMCPAQPQDITIRSEGKGVGLVICTIVVYSWGRFRGCWVGFYSLTAAISCCGAGERGGKWQEEEAWGNITWVRKGICRLRRRGGELRVASVAIG